MRANHEPEPSHRSHCATPTLTQVHAHAANTSFSMDASQDDGEPPPQRVYMIDPENSPGMVEELELEPHPDM